LYVTKANADKRIPILVKKWAEKDAASTKALSDALAVPVVKVTDPAAVLPAPAKSDDSYSVPAQPCGLRVADVAPAVRERQIKVFPTNPKDVFRMVLECFETYRGTDRCVRFVGLDRHQRAEVMDHKARALEYGILLIEDPGRPGGRNVINALSLPPYEGEMIHRGHTLAAEQRAERAAVVRSLGAINAAVERLAAAWERTDSELASNEPQGA
jgi:hypothetical protein